MSGRADDVEKQANFFRGLLQPLDKQQESSAVVKTVQSLMSFLIHNQIYPTARLTRRIGQLADDLRPTAAHWTSGGAFAGLSLRALSRVYSLLGDERYLDDCRRLKVLLSATRNRLPEANRQTLFSKRRQGQAELLLGLISYARIANDANVKEFVRQSYEHLRTLGISRIGLLGEPALTSAMTCLAVQLTDLGVGDYWEDIDQYVRNELVRVENKRASTIELANATVGLYAAWEGTLRFSHNVAQVNLLLNRASPWVDVDSYLPYEGKVAIRSKAPCRLLIRIPRWVDRYKVRSLYNGRLSGPTWFGRYLMFDRLGKGDTITVSFPIVDLTETHAFVSGKDPSTKVTLELRGNTVVNLTPSAKITGIPEYSKERYDDSPAPEVQVIRYASPVVVEC